jgi:hypothetical protein
MLYTTYSMSWISFHNRNTEPGVKKRGLERDGGARRGDVRQESEITL